MNRFIIRFIFHNSVHFGSDMPGIGQESSVSCFHSSTLFSAVCNVWAQIDWHLQQKGCKSLEDVLDMFRNGLIPFKLSSGFPFHGNSFYLPKPLREPAMLYDSANSRSSLEKKIKKVKYLKAEFFRNWLTEDMDYEGMAGNIADEGYNKGNFGAESIIPVTPVNRIDNGSNIYHSGNYFFDDECGLYAIIELDENIILKDHFKTVLDHVGKSGLGGNRNIGQGALKDIIVEDIPDELEGLFHIESRLGYCLLSLYYPASASFTNSVIAYNLVTKKGWIGSNSVNNSLKRKTCYMFSEGSVFSDIDEGSLVDTKPDRFDAHPVWQYGFAMTVPAKT